VQATKKIKKCKKKCVLNVKALFFSTFTSKKNMKKIAFIVILFSVFNSSAQELSIGNNGKYVYLDSVVFDSISKIDLFDQCMRWVSKNYSNPKEVLSYSSERSGEIVINANFPTNLFGKKGWIKHTMVLSCSDNVIRIEFTNISYFSTGSGNMPLEGRMMSKQKVIDEANLNIKLTVSSIVASIK